MDMSNNICRTCLSSTVELRSIFEQIHVNTGEPAEICQMILLCTGLEISKYDEFSHYICNACTDEAIRSYEYRDKCWKSQLFLMEQYQIDGKYEVSPEGLDDGDDEDMHETGDSNTGDSNTDEFGDAAGNFTIEFIDETELNDEKPKIHEENVVRTPVTSNRRVLPSKDEDILEYVNFTSDESSIYGKRYQCLMCDQVYVRPVTIRDHLIKIHKVTLKKRDGFDCKICGKVFDRKDRLVNHQNVHAPAKYICDVCGAWLKGKESLAEHKRRHTGEKPYKCQLCDFRAAQKSSMDVHNRVHTGEKPFKCHICGVAFKTSSGRANHRRQHSAERPYKCLICSKTFKTRGVFRGHMKTHDSIQSIECEFCHKKFPPGRIKFHLRQHSALPTYKCELCSKTFFQGASFQTHMKNRHFKDVIVIPNQE